MRELQAEIVNRAADEAGLPRRHFLRSLGLAAGGVGLLGLGVRPAAGQATPTPLEVVQFALALEHLEAVFYEQAVTFLTGRADANSPLAIATIIRNHEQTHEAALAAAVRCAGGTPVARCTYNFTFTDTAGFLATAKTLEETGVTAYHGALPFLIPAPEILMQAATIATMEARHASVIRGLIGEADPLAATGVFPTCSGDFAMGAFDNSRTIAEVKTAVAPLIASDACAPLKP